MPDPDQRDSPHEGSVTPEDVLPILAERTLHAEDDLFSVIPILGEPVGQRLLDDWVDQAVDLLRAIGESASELDQRLALARAAHPDSAGRSERPARGTSAGGGSGLGLGLGLNDEAAQQDTSAWAHSAVGHRPPPFDEELPE
jgi:hypothetical protein